MTQEDKQLLLKDLCTRVPYHPKGHVVNACNGTNCDEYLTCATFTMFTNVTNNCRLYLRPMSSMTEEEIKELLLIRLNCKYGENNAYVKNFEKINETILRKEKPYIGSIQVWFTFKNSYFTNHNIKEYREYSKVEYLGQINDITLLEIDWLNAHHFDYRGLIEKGLAIEAPKNMYKINNGNERIYIERKDSEWHPMNVEMPPHSTDVELLKPDGTIIKGEIVVEMSGYYIYLSPGWGDLNDYTHWRFIADKHYPDYE